MASAQPARPVLGDSLAADDKNDCGVSAGEVDANALKAAPPDANTAFSDA
jgi:hypothetical protein